MSNYIEYNDKMAFHPGYYIKEIIDDENTTQEDFAKRLGTTPKNLSILIRGDQALSIDMANKLSRLMNTSVTYWLNLQNAYDALLAESMSDEMLKEERNVFKLLDYKYFQLNFNLPSLPRQTDKQIEALRQYLRVSSLTVLGQKDLAVSYRCSNNKISQTNIIKANAMVQTATNLALIEKAPKYNKKQFEEAVEFAVTQTSNHAEFYPAIKERFKEAGVVLEAIPNLSGSKINGATKKIGDSILLMVNDRGVYADIFWFSLFHEIGHVINGDFGISMEKETGAKARAADKYAADRLIPEQEFKEFIKKDLFTSLSIKRFAESINRHPGIVVGRLKHEGIIDESNYSLDKLRSKYKCVCK